MKISPSLVIATALLAATGPPRRDAVDARGRIALYVCADYADMMNRTLACVVLNRYSSVVAIKRKESSVIDLMDAPG